MRRRVAMDDAGLDRNSIMNERCNRPLGHMSLPTHRNRPLGQRSLPTLIRNSSSLRATPVPGSPSQLLLDISICAPYRHTPTAAAFSTGAQRRRCRGRSGADWRDLLTRASMRSWGGVCSCGGCFRGSARLARGWRAAGSGLGLFGLSLSGLKRS